MLRLSRLMSWENRRGPHNGGVRPGVGCCSAASRGDPRAYVSTGNKDWSLELLLRGEARWAPLQRRGMPRELCRRAAPGSPAPRLVAVAPLAPPWRGAALPRDRGCGRAHCD